MRSTRFRCVARFGGVISLNISTKRMVLDINYFRSEKGGNPELIKENQRKRYKDPVIVDQIVQLDEQWRKVRFELDSYNKSKNVCNKIIGEKIKNKVNDSTTNVSESFTKQQIIDFTNEFVTALNITQIKDAKKSIDKYIEDANKQLIELEQNRNSLLYEIGNILHSSVPIAKEDEITQVVKLSGNVDSIKKYSHVDLLVMIDGVDYERGNKVAGNRGYFLKGPSVLIEHALIQLSFKILYAKQFTLLYTPFFMNKDMMHRVAQLSQFDEELYKVTTKNENTNEKTTEDKYLIATSEQPIAAYHQNEWIDPSILPLKYAGFSTCFRQEVGSHGRDTTGIFRVHQFEKVEQFCITSPSTSWEMFEEMINNAEQFYETLKIPFRIINIPSGDLNNAAAKKFDLEAWFPGSQSFKELVSCSNCTDYQSRRLSIRYGQTKKLNQDVQFVHMLNATMCATTRTICCLLENHQEIDGIRMPECLHPYLPDDLKFIKFVKPAPIDMIKK